MGSVVQLDEIRAAYRQKLMLGYWQEQENLPHLPWEHAPDLDPGGPIEWPSGSSRGLASCIGMLVLALAGAALLWVERRIR